MNDLIKRLEEAETGSRELDLAIWSSQGFIGTLGEKMGGVTTSLDAALALAEWVLPGWCWMIERHKNGTATAGLHEWNAYCEADQFTANTPALALCIAIIRAYEAGK